ncbi:hypothetical protein SLS62_006046 [Diatrype stigma]|uniref:Uncharacterized protein n=1 Tax=Diatrype stigma TaxID=117547 RepID=A0AAN9UTZ1_9PEZI
MSADMPNGATQHGSESELLTPSRPALHSLFSKVCTKNAKCDQCEKRNTSVMQKCQTCGMTTCKSCYDVGRYDGRHNLHGISLDWEPLVRDKRGRIIGTQPVRGVVKGKRGRPPHPPGTSKAGRGLVRESGSHDFERSLATASAATLPEIIVATTSDVSLIPPAIVHVKDRSPTPKGLDDCASSHHAGTDSGEVDDMMHVQSPEAVGQEYINARTPDQQGNYVVTRVPPTYELTYRVAGTLVSGQDITTPQYRKSLPAARPRQTASRPLPALRPHDATARSATPADQRQTTNSLSRVTRRVETESHLPRLLRQMSQSRNDAPVSPVLRRIITESVTRRSDRGTPKSRSPSIPSGPMDLSDEPESQVETWSHSERDSETLEAVQSLVSLESGGNYNNQSSANEACEESPSAMPLPQCSAATARQPPRLASIRSLGILPLPIQLQNERTSADLPGELINVVHFEGARSTENSRLPTSASMGLSHQETPDPTEERSVITQLDSVWQNNPIIEAQRNAKGPIAALEMQEASTILASMRCEMPRESLDFWFNGMRTALSQT